eukprot:gene15114-biopygen671
MPASRPWGASPAVVNIYDKGARVFAQGASAIPPPRPNRERARIPAGGAAVAGAAAAAFAAAVFQGGRTQERVPDSTYRCLNRSMLLKWTTHKWIRVHALPKRGAIRREGPAATAGGRGGLVHLVSVLDIEEVDDVDEDVVGVYVVQLEAAAAEPVRRVDDEPSALALPHPGRCTWNT